MKRKLIILGILLLVVINLSALATIGYHRCFHNGGKCNHSENNYLCQELSLSKPQVEKMETICNSFQFQADKTSSALLKKRIELVDHLTAVEPDSEKINVALKEIESMQSELQKQVIFYLLLKQKEILNPDQQQKFFSIIKERLLREAKHHQTNGLNPIENNCNSNHQN